MKCQISNLKSQINTTKPKTRKICHWNLSTQMRDFASAQEIGDTSRRYEIASAFRAKKLVPMWRNWRHFEKVGAHVAKLSRSECGFTLIELLVVFSIIAILGSVSMASFVDYSRTQELKAATSEMASFFTQAKSLAQSQVKPSLCGTNQLQGYEVRVCGLTGSTCSGSRKYALYVHCGVSPAQISTKTLPANLNFSDSQTTSRSFLFKVLHQGVSGAGEVVLTGYNKTQTISVTSSGTISTQ